MTLDSRKSSIFWSCTSWLALLLVVALFPPRELPPVASLLFFNKDFAVLSYKCRLDEFLNLVAKPFSFDHKLCN